MGTLIKRRGPPGPARLFSLSSTVELKFQTKTIHNTDPCYLPNNEKNTFLKRVC